jgi:hypothetical protein
MSTPTQGMRPGPSLGGSLRVFGWAVALVVGGGVPTAFGALQAMWSPDPFVRIGLLVVWSTRGPLLALAAPVLDLVPGLMLAAAAALAAVLLASRLTRRTAAPPNPAAPDPTPPPPPLVVVGGVTGALGRAWLDGRSWTVHSAERLRNGEVYVVLARDGDVLEVGACP